MNDERTKAYAKTYWCGKGKYEVELATLQALIPPEGPVQGMPALETLRKAQNAYYDLYNNGGCNRGDDIRRFLGVRVRPDDDDSEAAYPFEDEAPLGEFRAAVWEAETRMDAIIRAAVKEQAKDAAC